MDSCCWVRAAAFQIQYKPDDEGATYALRRFKNLAGAFTMVESAAINIVDGIVTLTDSAPLPDQAFYQIVRTQEQVTKIL